MRAVRFLIAAAVITPLAGGCTAIKATIHMADAEKALSSAEEYGARDMATYEYTMALRYLEKAKEEITYNEYRTSEDLSKKSAEWSDKAIIFIQGGGRLSGEEFHGVEDIGGAPVIEGPQKLPDEVVPVEPTPEPVNDGLWEDTTTPDPEPEPEPDPVDDFGFEDDEDFEMETP